MLKSAKANFAWTANGSKVNFDTHGDGGGESISYEKGGGVAEDSGVLEAAFDGNHGWFWRNRTGNPVTVTLKTDGAYSDIKRATHFLRLACSPPPARFRTCWSSTTFTARLQGSRPSRAPQCRGGSS